MSAIQSLLHHMGSGSAEWQGNSTASMTESSTSIDEGQTLTSTITTTNCPDGVVLYWTVDQHTGAINSSDFSAYSGTAVINSNSGSITTNIVADVATEGEEKFAILLFTDSGYSNNIASTNVITINDTSTAPTQHSHSSGTINVPANAYDISFECSGGAGGKGGAGGASRSNGGSGRSSWFTTNLTAPYTVNLWPGTKGVDAYDPPVGDPTFPNGCSGWSGGAGGSSAVGMSGGTGGASGGIDNAGSKSCNVGGGGSGGAGSLIQISGVGYVAIAAGGGGGGGSAGSTTGDSGGNYSGYGGSTPWVATTSSLENGSGASGGSGTDTNDAAGGGGSGGGASYTAVAAGAAGGSNASSVGQGGGSGVSAYRSDVMSQGSNSHNPGSNGYAMLYFKTP